jgi:hypothetical protein
MGLSFLKKYREAELMCQMKKLGEITRMLHAELKE